MLALVDQTGKILSTYGEHGSYETPAVSPDGKRVAYTRDCRIYVRDLQRGEENLLTTEAGALIDWQDRSPTWSQDGTRVLYGSNRSGSWDIYSKDASGVGAAEALVEKPFNQGTPTMGRHGTLVFTDTPPETAADIWIRNPDGKLAPWLVTTHQEVTPTLSPDERLIAYASDASQRFEIYVSFLSDKNKRITISTDGGMCPVWSPKGGRLFFRQGTKIMVVEVGPEGSPKGKPQKLFDGEWALGTSGGLPISATNLNISGFAVMPDGEHFLMVYALPKAIPTGLNVIFNFSEELKRLVPTGKK
jgi:Tol biopolymer transport system component